MHTAAFRPSAFVLKNYVGGDPTIPLENTESPTESEQNVRSDSLELEMRPDELASETAFLRNVQVQTEEMTESEQLIRADQELA